MLISNEQWVYAAMSANGDGDGEGNGVASDDDASPQLADADTTQKLLRVARSESLVVIKVALKLSAAMLVLQGLAWLGGVIHLPPDTTVQALNPPSQARLTTPSAN